MSLIQRRLLKKYWKKYLIPGCRCDRVSGEIHTLRPIPALVAWSTDHSCLGKQDCLALETGGSQGSPPAFLQWLGFILQTQASRKHLGPEGFAEQSLSLGKVVIHFLPPWLSAMVRLLLKSLIIHRGAL